MFALVALSLSLAAPSAPASSAPAPSPQPIAVLPVTGDGVSLADLALLEDIDAMLRASIAERKELALQPRELTAETFRSSRGAGVECKVNDLPCMRQVAALAGVDLMLVPVAAVDGKGLELELTLIAVVDEAIVTRTVIITGRGRAADAFVRATVDDVMTAPRKKVAAAPVVAAAPTSAAPGAAAAGQGEPAPPSGAPAVDEAENATPMWPFVAGGVGAVVLVAAAVGVGVVFASGALSDGGAGGGGGDGDPVMPTSGPVTVVLE